MAVTYNLGTTPFWYFPDLNGKALVGGYLYSRPANNPSLFKPIYADAGGTQPYPNPMPISGNGLASIPMYFANDENYLLQITSNNDANPQVLYSINNFNPAAGGGGSPPVNTFTDLTNLIANGQFIYNVSPSTTTAITSSLTTLAPSNHDGLTTPDIVLRKNSTASTESINFVAFNQGDTIPTQTPRFYLNYSCSVIGNENQKDIEFPISAHVRTLENTVTTFSFWALSSTNSTIEVFSTQYFGDGSNSPSLPVNSTLQAQALTNGWVKYSFNITPPTTIGKTIGNCGNDYLVMTIRAPLSQIFNIGITNVMLVAGDVTADFTYSSQDETNSVVNSPRTGDVKLGFNNSVYPSFGWVPMNDGSIGSSLSGATTRASVDTFPLYNLLWNNVLDLYAPVTGGRGGSAALDFAANKPMQLTKVLGRALSGAGLATGQTTTWALGQTTGEEKHLLTAPELPPLDYTGSSVNIPYGITRPAVGATPFDLSFPAGPLNSTTPVTIVTNAGNQSHNTMQPTTFMNVYIKL